MQNIFSFLSANFRRRPCLQSSRLFWVSCITLIHQAAPGARRAGGWVPFSVGWDAEEALAAFALGLHRIRTTQRSGQESVLLGCFAGGEWRRLPCVVCLLMPGPSCATPASGGGSWVAAGGEGSVTWSHLFLFIHKPNSCTSPSLL